MANLFTSVDKFQTYRENLKSPSIGLVPTMGNLHEGHLSLIRESLLNNETTIVTIFVNPKQFGPNEDFEKYPRTLESDLEKINSLDPNIVVLAPNSTKEIYPDNYTTVVSVADLTRNLCGADRPGHFDGVTTIVYRLFAITKAHNAYFGQKDYQQLQVIRRMSEDLLLPIKIHMLPIHREESGLARSSRNQFLSDKEREVALTLTEAILSLESIIKDKTFIDALSQINSKLEEEIKDENWNYLEILDSTTLSEVNINTNEVVIAGAYKVGNTRLIDNTLVKIQYA